MNAVSDYLKQLKSEKSVSYQKIADATGISTGTLSHIGTGRTKQPDPETLRKLAMYFADNDATGAAVVYEEFMSRAGYLAALPKLTEEEIVLRLRRDFPDIYRAIVDALEAPG
jgi:transcriptional regulator with XRE-family HTH domain